ncbi:MAG: hypothetical protein FWH37_09620 [Candidatus Bathyarchaeota archaeon]|nr:hypothetical protein [Candidatus Termiticorpusculum sp.]
MTTETEFKKLKEAVVILVKKIGNINELLTKRLIETVEPLPDEIKATKQYQKGKKNKTIEFIPLENLQRP